MEKSVDNKGIFGILLTDLLKAFDCRPEKQLLIARASDQIFHFKALELIYSNINSRKQRLRINRSFNDWVVAF